MSEKIKNALGSVLILFFLVFILFFVTLSIGSIIGVLAYSRSVEPSSFRNFSVSGEGKVVAIPDIASFSLSVITEGDKNIGILQEENTKNANEIIAFLKGNGIDPKDVKTQAYSMAPRYQYANCTGVTICPPPEIVGYTISQTILVKIRDFSKISEILGGVVTKGANNVSGLTFSVDDPTELQSQARAEAIRKAKEKAESVALAGSFSLGKLLSIEEGLIGSPRYNEYARLDLQSSNFAREKAAPTPTIEPGSQEIVVNVTLQYEIR
jgi:uncharacterized protein YggE